MHWRASDRLPPIRVFALLAATLLGLYVCYLLVLPFLAALAWALAIAVLTMPAYEYMENRLGNPSLAAAIFVILLALLVMVPLSWVGLKVVGELSSGLAVMQEQVASGHLRQILVSSPRLEWIANAIEQRIDLRRSLVPRQLGSPTWERPSSASHCRNLLTGLLTFYLLFYFLRDRGDALGQARLLSPLTDDDKTFYSPRHRMQSTA